MDEITLKDCPFCGGIAEAVSASYAADAVVANAWNSRTGGADHGTKD